MKFFTSSVSPKGQVTIPHEIREQLGIKPKDKVIFQVDGKTIRILNVKAGLEASYQAVPALKNPMTLEEMMEAAREEHALEIAKEGLEETV